MQQSANDKYAAELDHYYKELYAKYYAQQIDALKSELDRLHADNVALREDKQRSMKQIEQLSEVEAQAQARIQALNAEKTSLNEFVGQLRLTIEKIENTIGTLRRKLSKSRQQTEAYRSELFRVRRALAERIAKLNELAALMRDCEADSQQWQGAQKLQGADAQWNPSAQNKNSDTIGRDIETDRPGFEDNDSETEKANLQLAALINERSNSLQQSFLSLRSRFDALLDEASIHSSTIDVEQRQ